MRLAGVHGCRGVAWASRFRVSLRLRNRMEGTRHHIISQNLEKMGSEGHLDTVDTTCTSPNTAARGQALHADSVVSVASRVGGGGGALTRV